MLSLFSLKSVGGKRKRAENLFEKFVNRMKESVPSVRNEGCGQS